MAVPIEMHKGNERKTVYSDIKENALLKKGWSRVSDLTERQRDLLAQGKLPATKAKESAKSVEKQLEAETGKDFVRSGNNPPTFVETDAPAPDSE